MGPGVFLKILFSLQYLFDVRFETREIIGKFIVSFGAQNFANSLNYGVRIVGESFQRERTLHSAFTTAVSVTSATALFAAIIFYQWLAITVAAAFVFSLGYGAITGCIHNLPLKPWMCK